MLKKCAVFILSILASISIFCCYAEESRNIASLLDENTVKTEIDLYSPETNQSFILDPVNSTPEMVRICVPLLYPKWIAIPTWCIDGITTNDEKVIEGEKYPLVNIKFSEQYSQLNTILPAAQELIYEESEALGLTTIEERFKWPPKIKWPEPWKWSKCAKCKLEVNIFLTGSVIAGCVAAGITPPGAIPVMQSLIVGKYGLAGWEAIRATASSASISFISAKICKAKKKC